MLRHKPNWAIATKDDSLMPLPLDGFAKPQSKVSLTHNGGLERCFWREHCRCAESGR